MLDKLNPMVFFFLMMVVMGVGLGIAVMILKRND